MAICSLMKRRFLTTVAAATASVSSGLAKRRLTTVAARTAYTSPAMMNLTTVAARAASTSGIRHFSAFYSKVHMNEYNPVAKEAIVDATKVAIHHKQKFVEAESLIIALLDQNHGITEKNLNEVNIEVECLRGVLMAFIDTQPKIHTFRDNWNGVKYALAANGFVGFNFIAAFMEVIDTLYLLRFGKFFGMVRTPSSHLGPLLMEAKKYMMRRGDGRIGEEHLLMAYTRDPRFGDELFTTLGITDNDLGHAARVIRTFGY